MLLETGSQLRIVRSDYELENGLATADCRICVCVVIEETLWSRVGPPVVPEMSPLRGTRH